MGKTLVYKILSEHLLEGKLAAGEPIGIRIDQTLTQDATGTTAFLLYESMGGGKVKTDLSVSYVDHNMAGFGPENHNDHLYLLTVAAKSGVYHSRPGNGICRFRGPGPEDHGLFVLLDRPCRISQIRVEGAQIHAHFRMMGIDLYGLL